MEAAVSKRRKRFVLILLAVAVVGAAATVAYAELRYGPFFCGECQLRNPTPDLATRNMIEERRSFFDWATAPIGPDTVYVICNASACVDYRQNLSGHWEGSNARPVQNGVGAGGGSEGGGGGSGGGGIAPGSGGGGGGSGTPPIVIVGEDRPA